MLGFFSWEHHKKELYLFYYLHDRSMCFLPSAQEPRGRVVETMVRERQLLLSGEGRTRSTVQSLLVPVALAAIIAKSSFLAYPRDAAVTRTALLQQRVRAFARQQGGRQRLIQLADATRRKSPAATAAERRHVVAARLTALDDEEAADPDEKALRAQMGRGWTYRGDAHVGSSAGGPGMPLTGSYAMTPEDLKTQQFKKVARQRQFEDFVVDGRTGRPIDLTDEQKRMIKRHQMEDEAKEQEDVDAMSDPFRDANVPSQFIYPDGEAIIPKEFGLKIHGLSDKHVMANGTVTEHQGPLGGIFREGSFDGDGANSTIRYNKFGEGMGFTDRPLAIRDVDYAKLRDDRLKGLEMRENETEAFRIARINGTEHKFYCSGRECDDQWGVVGDQVVDLRTGETIHEGVGPGDEVSPDKEYWVLDRHFDPHTGVELNHCVGPQCHGYQWEESKPLIEDKYGDATRGHGNFGGAYPSEGTTDPQQIREHQRAGDGGATWDGEDPNELTYEPYDMDPRMKARYDLYEKESRHDNIGSGVSSCLLCPSCSRPIFLTQCVAYPAPRVQFLADE